MKAILCARAFVQKRSLTPGVVLASLFLLLFSSAAADAQDESLLIGPGDVIHVQVFETPELDQHVRVTDTGTVPLMFIGATKVAGLTPTAAAQVIGKELVAQQYLRNPQVTVVVEQYATQNVSILGEVQRPGAFPLPTPLSILKVLSLAGGLTQTADRNITIERHGNNTEKVNYFLSNAANQAVESSVVVYPGDTVIVPKAGIVYVLGDVGRPGGYTMSTNNSEMTLMQAVAMAGSTSKTAIPNKVRLIRKTAAGPQDSTVSLAAIEKGSQTDVTLKPDDIVFVPFSWMKNMAMSSSSIAASAAGSAIYAAHP